MPDDGSGNYTLASTNYTGDDIAQQEKAAVSIIGSVERDSLFIDIKNALNNRLNISGAKAMTGNLDVGGFNIINVGSGNNTIQTPVYSSFTPSFVNGSWGYSVQNGNKIVRGNEVQITIRINGTVLTQSGNIEIAIPDVATYDVPALISLGTSTGSPWDTGKVNGIVNSASSKIIIYESSTLLAVPTAGNIVQFYIQANYQKA